MSTEDNKALVRRHFEEVLNQGNLAVFDELYAPDFIFHEPAFPQVHTREDAKRWLTHTLNTFPDFHATVDDMIAEGDQVAGRFTVRGTDTRDTVVPRPHSATGKQFIVTGIAIARIANGQFVEMWHQVDHLGWRQQLGLIPARGQR
jgi:steroid delta-isomerase-like uncharacterized protein